MRFHDRHKYVGASEAAQAIGLSTHRTAHDLWMEKTLRDPGTERKRVMDRGHRMEPVIVELLAEKGIKVSEREGEYRRDETPFLVSHIDGLIEPHEPLNDQDPKMVGAGILEMKAPGSRMISKIRNEGAPVEHILQMQVNLYNTGGEWGMFAYYDHDAYELIIVYVESNKELQQNVAKEVARFWDYVVNDTEPPVDPVPPPNWPVIVAGASGVGELSGGGVLLSELADAYQRKKEAELRWEDARSYVMGVMVKDGIEVTEKVLPDGRTVKVTWKVASGRKSYDSKAMMTWIKKVSQMLVDGDTASASEYAARFLESEAEMFVKKGKPTRPFRLTVKGEEE